MSSFFNINQNMYQQLLSQCKEYIFDTKKQTDKISSKPKQTTHKRTSHLRQGAKLFIDDLKTQFPELEKILKQDKLLKKYLVKDLRQSFHKIRSEVKSFHIKMRSILKNRNISQEEAVEQIKQEVNTLCNKIDNPLLRGIFLKTAKHMLEKRFKHLFSSKNYQDIIKYIDDKIAEIELVLQNRFQLTQEQELVFKNQLNITDLDYTNNIDKYQKKDENTIIKQNKIDYKRKEETKIKQQLLSEKERIEKIYQKKEDEKKAFNQVIEQILAKNKPQNIA